MKNKSICKLELIFCIILLSISQCISQNYFITVGKDSIPCHQINFFNTNAQGKIIEFEYVSKENKIVLLKEKDMPEIKTICQDGVLYLRMPLKIKKPNGYYRYGKREVYGKISVDVFNDTQTSYRLKENFDGSYSNEGVMKANTEGIYLRHVTLPNGNVYEVSGLKGIKAVKIIRKFMFECEQHKKEYYSNPKYQTCSFEEAVMDYNKMCP